MVAKSAFWTIAILVLVLAVDMGAHAPLAIRVTPALARAPANVMIQAVVDPHAANRAIMIVVDSGGYYRASTLEVDGDKGARTYTVRFPQLPAGNYEVCVILLGSQGEERASQTRSLAVF